MASLPPIIHGVEWAYNESLSNTDSGKTTEAMCPWGMQVTGGHADTHATGPVVLTRLEPIRRFSTDSSGNQQVRYGYRVDAKTPYATGADSYGNWSVWVQAICIDPTPGYHIAKATTPASTTARQNASVACASDERVLGTGAAVEFYRRQNPDGTVTAVDHGIGLQVAMAASDGTYARARASVVPGGYAYPWQVTTYAVCADTPGGYSVRNSSSDRYSDDETRLASVECGYYAYNSSVYHKVRLDAGGGLSDNAPVNANLTTLLPAPIHPYYSFESVAWGKEIVPTSTSWHVTAQVICAGGPIP